MARKKNNTTIYLIGAAAILLYFLMRKKKEETTTPQRVKNIDDLKNDMNVFVDQNEYDKYQYKQSLNACSY